MLDGNDSYEGFHTYAHLPGPQPSAFADPITQQEEADAFALKFAVAAVDMSHYVEDSNPDHKSWMFHITWAVMPEFAANCGRGSTAQGSSRRVGLLPNGWAALPSAGAKERAKLTGLHHPASNPPAPPRRLTQRTAPKHTSPHCTTS